MGFILKFGWGTFKNTSWHGRSCCGCCRCILSFEMGIRLASRRRKISVTTRFHYTLGRHPFLVNGSGLIFC